MSSEKEKENKEIKKDSEAEKKKRNFILNKHVDSSSLKDIIMGIIEINDLDEKSEKEDVSYIRKPIKIIISSYGGSIYDGIDLASVMDTSETPIHTYCYGKAMSMGFFIFALGHKRFAHPLATFMYHNGAVTASGDYKNIEYTVEQGNKLVSMMDKYIVNLTSISQEKLDYYKERRQNWYMFTDEAYKYGLVDEILKSKRNVYKGNK